ncbi:rhomboid family intramembrane serine protease [Amycolatopsis antarctica]|uniref:Rhomboid family intramembrane serine protease n=1 Tax=Amycolatopsis antarctica TaxID=1854586 RepID=A0A263D2D0_9PSEU|nr:rhomboid family intramembrane serine protease [Amycolatopsis antarctica]OZM72610.1 rhomboid family intramembrane serine protease [Amycolatopsis antarctica]
MTQPPFPPPPEQPTGPQYQQAAPACWWHPNRQTGLRCTRCDRPACPDCLREASVGYQCIDCVQTGQAQQRSANKQYRSSGFGRRTVAGAIAPKTAIVTPILIAINVLVYGLTAVQSGNPMENQTSAFFESGVLWPYAISGDGDWLRLLTSGFLHYGLIHLAMNMLALWVLGRDLEILLGRVRFIAVYAISLLGGSAAVFAFGEPNTGTAGASGAIYGLMGAMAIAVFRLKLNPAGALGIIGINVVLSITIPGISLLGHFGGLVLGGLAMAAMVYSPEKGRNGWQAGTVAFLAVAVAGLVIFRDVQLTQQICDQFGFCARV